MQIAATNQYPGKSFILKLLYGHKKLTQHTGLNPYVYLNPAGGWLLEVEIYTVD